MFMAFLLRENPIGDWRPEVLLGLVIGAAGLGNTLGITMPTKPPITHASCSVVSERAKALAWIRPGTSRWMVESSDSLASACARPAVRPSRTSGTRP